MERSGCLPESLPDEARSVPERRVVAVVLPQLACELLHAGTLDEARPLGVVVVDAETTTTTELRASAPLHAVNPAAQRVGVSSGQTIAEARALVAGLQVRQITRRQIESALQAVADVAFGFGTTVAIRLHDDDTNRDTVWVDISGVSALFGGERQLLVELANGVRALGHETRIAVAAGPWLAQALARWGASRALRELPVVALPLEPERVAWLARVGVHTWGELAALPREATASRLGARAALTLDLCAGRDRHPLVAYQPPRQLTEERSFEDVLDGLQPLAFVLRGLTSRIAGRLAGRGEAAQSLVVTLQHDRSIARLRGVAPSSEWRFELSPPLHRENDLYRLVMSRLERASLGAPTEAVRVTVPLITRAPARQLGFLSTRGVDELPVLLAELAADIGTSRVGVLRVVDSLRPEAQSVLGRPVIAGATRKAPRQGRREPASRGAKWPAGAPVGPRVPTRLLPRPLPLRVALREGNSLFLGRRAFTIERIIFERRLDAVEWWSSAPASRDYFRLLLRGSTGVVEALIFVDRQSRARFLQAIYD